MRSIDPPNRSPRENVCDFGVNFEFETKRIDSRGLDGLPSLSTSDRECEPSPSCHRTLLGIEARKLDDQSDRGRRAGFDRVGYRARNK